MRPLNTMFKFSKINLIFNSLKHVETYLYNNIYVMQTILDQNTPGKRSICTPKAYNYEII